MIRQLGMDLMMVLFVATASILLLILPLISEPLQKHGQSPETAGAMYVELVWPENQPCDVDLWVWNSVDKTAVGYSNKTGEVFSLLKDDLGQFADLTSINQENTISRGLPDGEYIINLHLFSVNNCRLPVPFRVTVHLQKAKDKPFETLFTVDGVLRNKGEERTVGRFFLAGGSFDRKSFNTLQTPLRGKLAEAHE